MTATGPAEIIAFPTAAASRAASESERFLSVSRWREYQYYKDRRPIWIKLYLDLLDKQDFSELPVTTQLLWFKLLLLAARTGNVMRKRS